MKTIKQLADEIGISKQRVYRYIKNHITDAHQTASVIQLDDALEKLIRERFFVKTTSSKLHHDVHQNHITDAACDAVFDAIPKQMEEDADISKQSIRNKTANLGLQKNDNQFAFFEQEIERLHNQLNAKDQQLAEKDKQLADVTRLLDQQQQLQMKLQLQLEEKNKRWSFRLPWIKKTTE